MRSTATPTSGRYLHADDIAATLRERDGRARGLRIGDTRDVVLRRGGPDAASFVQKLFAADQLLRAVGRTLSAGAE